MHLRIKTLVTNIYIYIYIYIYMCVCVCVCVCVYVTKGQLNKKDVPKHLVCCHTVSSGVVLLLKSTRLASYPIESSSPLPSPLFSLSLSRCCYYCGSNSFFCCYRRVPACTPPSPLSLSLKLFSSPFISHPLSSRNPNPPLPP